MKLFRHVACLLPLLAVAAHAQDDRKVVSPDGRLEFRLFTAVPEGGLLNCLAYQVWLQGKPLLDTSYLGLNIHFQEPLLGENVGLSNDKPLHGDHYNGLFADYLQTSTTGRRIQLEVRVWNDGVAFRYIVPTSPLIVNLLLEDDVTQFAFMQEAVGGRPEKADLPYVEPETGGTWIGIYGLLVKIYLTSPLQSTTMVVRDRPVVQEMNKAGIGQCAGALNLGRFYMEVFTVNDSVGRGETGCLFYPRGGVLANPSRCLNYVGVILF